MNRSGTGAVCAAVLALAACNDTTGILVEVTSSDLRVPSDVDELRFQAIGADGTVADSMSVELTGTWPYSMAIHPPASGALPEVEITVTAQKDGEFRVRRVVRVFFDENATRRVTIDLPRSCLGMMCPDGVDCVAGMCTDVRMDGGVDPDGGLDAGVGDSGVFDAGSPRDAGADASGADGGPPDACVMSTETCNDADDDCDGRLDEGLPCPGSIVISEFATGAEVAAGGGRNEFVELYNTTPHSIALSGVAIQYASEGSTSFANRAVFGAAHVIPANGFFLAASVDYSGAAVPDLPMSWPSGSGFAQAGGHLRVILVDVELDRVGWGGAIAPETNPITSSSDGPGSYERKARMDSTAATMAAGGAHASAGNSRDSNDNAADFVRRAMREPQNGTSPSEVP